MSRAELEAEQKVALSADKIIEMLRQETGLLLQVKKKLVREAFAQGRILDPSDLTDDALFRLLRDDENIRVLATREIENRYYVRAKPTKQEIEQQQVLAAQLGLSRAGSALAATGAPTARPAGVSQEDAYWAQQARGYEGASRGGTGQAPSQSISPPSAQPVRPENRLPDNPARQTNRTSLEGQDEFEDMDSGDLPRISPDQLSALLSTGSTSAPGSGTTPGASGIVPLSLISGMDPGMNGPGAKNLGSIGSLPVPLTSPDESTGPASLQTSQRAKLEGTRRPRTPSVTDLDLDRPQIRHRPNPYADVPSLYDLYAQVARQPAIIDRFGAAVFRNNGGNLDDLPMDLPAGPDYVLGPGDGLTIEMWGGIAQRMRRVVDREGRIALPEVGTVQVSGRTLGDVQHMVQSVLRTQFRDVEADVSLGRIRTVRVYVVGEVANPGAYDISSLSTHLNALYAAGGPTSRGSLRHLRHMRGNQLIQEVDTYDLLLRGTHSELARIQSGDTILVPPVGTEVVVEGMVRRPAIYELDQEKNLAEALELAGGVLPSGTLRHVDVERMVAHEKRTMLRLDLPETNDVQAVNKALEEFQVQDGDQIRISPILPYSDKTVYLDGHVFRPGKYPYRDGMKVTDVIRSYSELLPEPSARHAEIIRLQPPDYTPQVFAFNLAAAMEGKEQNVALKPFDTIRIFGRYDFEDQPLVTVTGEVRQPGDHVTNGVTHLRDAVHLAGGVTADAELEDAQVFRRLEDGKLKVLSVNLQKALSGDPAEDVLLEPKDRVFIHRSQSKLDPPSVQIQGEVARPGKYPLGNGMTASDLVKLAGGMRRSADTQQADLARYLEPDGKSAGHEPVEIAKAMTGLPGADVPLSDGDVLTIRQLPGWQDRGATIAVKGEVVHPGTYGIRQGERLSSVLARAGGFREGAYPYGAILERAQVRELEEKTRADLIGHMQAEGASLKLIPDTGDQKMAKQAALLQWQAAMEKLQNTPPTGRLVVHISPNSKKWANTPADIEVRAGDVLTIPKAPNFVLVNGSVYNPTAVTFKPGKSARWYLTQAGGPTTVASKKSIFLVRADGSVVGGSGGLFSGGVLGAEMRPGDMLVVPEKAYSGTTRWKNTLEAAQLAYAVGVAIQVARSF